MSTSAMPKMRNGVRYSARIQIESTSVTSRLNCCTGATRFAPTAFDAR